MMSFVLYLKGSFYHLYYHGLDLYPLRLIGVGLGLSASGWCSVGLLEDDWVDSLTGSIPFLGGSGKLRR